MKIDDEGEFPQYFYYTNHKARETMMRSLLLCCIIASLAMQSIAFTSPQCVLKKSSYNTAAAADRHINLKSSVTPSVALKARLQGDDDEVNVTEMEVDAFTLTAVGFGLIAFNFLVLANVRIMTFWFCYFCFVCNMVYHLGKIPTSTLLQHPYSNLF